MAEGLLFNTIEKLIGKLSSLAVESPYMRDALESLKGNMLEIKAVVMDAEEQQRTNHQVKVWVDKLKNALYDAEDLVDEISTEDLRRQVITRDKKAKKVRIFFSSSNQLLFTFKMSMKIKAMEMTLEALNVGSKSFNFINRKHRVAKQRDTYSFIREEDVIGREEEKELLLEMLLDTSVDVKQNFYVICIIGIGGLGKTALAQLLFNDKAVQEHFEFKKWVCVSDDEFDEFNVQAIASKIIKSKTDDDMDEVQLKLREKVGGKRYLLVLDDVWWNEDRESWLRLRTLLMGGAKGSKIIITTRSEQVAKTTGPSSPFQLKGLDEEKSWKLFSQLAFEKGKEPENQKLVSIGKDFVKKCSGVPLAIRSIGNLMFLKTEDEWLDFKDKDLVKINGKGVKGVFQPLKLRF